MKTKEMVAMLATGIEPAQRHVADKRFGVALLAGLMVAVVLIAWCFGVRPDLATMLVTPLFWAKLAFPLCLAAAALLAAVRLSRPGVPVGKGWAALAAPVLVVWLAAAAVLVAAPAGTRMPLILGDTWRNCPFNIALLSVPAFVAVMWAMKGLAPTQLRRAGAMGGLLAGSTATVAYCLHCPEMAVPFWAVWYLLGMLIPAAVGALLGPRLLRW